MVIWIRQMMIKLGGTQSHIAEYQRVLLVRWEPGSHFGFHGIVAFVTIMSPVNHRIVQWIPTWLMCESQWFAIMFPTVSPHLGKFNSEFSCLWEILLVSLSPLSVNFSSASLRYPANFRKTIWAASFYLPSQDDTDLPPKSLKKKDFGQENLPFPCRETQAKASLRRGLSNSALRFRPDFHGNERNSFWWIQDSGWRIHTHIFWSKIWVTEPCSRAAILQCLKWQEPPFFALVPQQ